MRSYVRRSRGKMRRNRNRRKKKKKKNKKKKKRRRVVTNVLPCKSSLLDTSSI